MAALLSANAAVLEAEEKERKFNAEEMCYVSSERSLVGAACKPDHGEDNLVGTPYKLNLVYPQLETARLQPLSLPLDPS